ncbi:gamma-glutamylcyclotransferase [Pseudoroseicyclus tamaricis]|uniref:glutathione-specific gamma-glutamylcyclotransferase n=1 Tax=Pseudoroseicyclus tamaricis TaxID=2705421 RepID=A0A6B2JMM9_9RHOB|nr:gamma-glutamylcyclotransferase [Pseudoroseicyclus tamaricis]NDU99916.1 gamma-glutamylcyclotransferase [Pseudoroseicyclus tamaricis]
MSLWVFGYGSLLWNPGFTPEESAVARLDGFERSFCMLSIHHRGTEEVPGLVLALDETPGARCTGMALKVRPEEEPRVLAELRERELVSSAYQERHLPVVLADGRIVTAVTYVVDRAHRQYCRFDEAVQAEMIARASGGRGPNPEYLFNTAAHLGEIGLADPALDALAERVRALVATVPGSGGANAG